MASDTGGRPQKAARGGIFDNEWIPPGLLFMAVGALGLYVSRGYDMGDVNHMGPGWFPRALCIGLLILGALIFWVGVVARRPLEGKGSATRGFVFIILAMAIFALTIEGMNIPFLGVKVPSLGFILSLTLALLIAAAADRGQKPLEVLFTTALIVCLAFLTFIMALKLPFRLWPEL